MAQIKPAELYMGVRMGNISGKHHTIKDDIIKPKCGDMNKKPKQVRFQSDEVGIIEWDELNHQRRGFRDKLKFRGQAPQYWKPDEFKRDMVGGLGADSGASRGGDFTVKPARKYAPTFANVKQPNPHPIKLNKQLKKIKS